MKYPFWHKIYCYEIMFFGIREEEIYNFAHVHNLDCWGYNKADDNFSLMFTLRGKNAITKSSTLGAHIASVRARGLLPFLLRSRARVGLALGGVASVLLAVFFSTLVWDVRITGNERYTDSYIKAQLAQNGLAVGTHIPSFDRSAFAAAYLQKEDDLAYLAVNFRGTVAYVQVLERLAPPQEEEKQGGANLVAKTDAVIFALSVNKGTPLVGKGSVVRAGDGLVSGILEGAQGSRVVYAEGEVIGRVRHTLTVTVSQKAVNKELRDLSLSAVSLKIFGRELNIFKKYSNSPPIYDTIYKNKCFYVKNAPLPLSFIFAYMPIYEEKTQLLSEKETVALAIRQMNEELTQFLQDKELLARRLHGSFDGEQYTLTCELECLENIAVTQEFSLG